jgi:nickel-dependent lactate racemase
MRITLDYGRRSLDLDVEPERLIGNYRGPRPIADLEEATRQALEAPVNYPPLRRALTPDDHVVVVLDARLPQPHRVLVPVLDHILQMDVAPEAITLLCPETGQSAEWLDELPERHEEVHVEEHDPGDRKKLAYLATTRGGRRLYLNRTLVDADQVVVVTSRRYDGVLGYAGAEGSLFPAFSDEATRAELRATWRLEPPGEDPWPARAEAIEVAWLLGQPFYVQLLASSGDGVSHVVAGAADAAKAGARLLDKCWRPELPRRADVALVPLSGDPARRSFADLAAAALAASRVVRPGGRIVLLCDAAPEPGAGMDLVVRAEGPEEALQAVRKAAQPGSGPALSWARAAGHARVSVLSRLPGQAVEDLFASPLEDAGQVQRLVSGGGECVVLQDAQRMMAVLS